MKKKIQQLPSYKNFSLDVLRLDLLHPLYGGNKYFKLKYNIESVVLGRASTPLRLAQDRRLSMTVPAVLTFGGAHSNHIYSTAAYCNEQNIKSIGVIRGEETMLSKSPTLQFAKEQGMHLYFISREKYKGKADADFVEELKKQFGDFYLIPEGGNNEEGIKGCIEILDDVPFYDYVFCACGTACTYTGILASAKPSQKVIGISVLKGENELIEDVNTNAERFKFEKIAPYTSGQINKSTILNNYHFGGYAKHTQQLLDFKRKFEKENEISLDYVYTSKLLYAVYDLIDKGLMEPNKSSLIVHSGGQKGKIEAMRNDTKFIRNFTKINVCLTVHAEIEKVPPFVILFKKIG